MKNFVLFTLIATLSFPLIIKAEDILLPKITSPVVLQEGTQTSLTDAQIAELRPWAINSRNSLNELLQLRDDFGDKYLYLGQLIDGVQKIVKTSNPKNSELLMRYILNRGLAINEILSRESQSKGSEVVNTKIRLMISTIKMALVYSDIDLNTLERRGNASFAVFGIEYFCFLTKLNKSVLDSSAQFEVEKAAVEWLQWDLYRDSNNKKYASQIVKINESLKNISSISSSNPQANLIKVRQLKKLEEQINVADLIENIPEASAEQVSRVQRLIQNSEQSNEQVIFSKEESPSFIKKSDSKHEYEIEYAHNLNIDQHLTKEVSINVPLITTGNSEHPINWDATIGMLNPTTNGGYSVYVDGKRYGIDMDDGDTRYLTVGIQGRKCVLNDLFEAVVKAEYAKRLSDPQSIYKTRTGQDFDPNRGLNISVGMNFILDNTGVVVGVSVSTDPETKETSYNVSGKIRF